VVSRENVEIVRRAFEQFRATGEPAWNAMHEAVEAFDHDIFDGQDYRGHAGIRRWFFEDWGSAWSEWSAEAEEPIDVDDARVILVLRIKAKGQGSGVELERQDAMLFKLRDGLTVRIDYYNSKQQALNAAGLEE
jgi:ketosteroid isomerase-like protein